LVDLSEPGSPHLAGVRPLDPAGSLIWGPNDWLREAAERLAMQ
jgi:hypothetical protein